MKLSVRNFFRDFYRCPVKGDFEEKGVFISEKENLYFQTDQEEKKIVFIQGFKENEEKTFSLKKIDNPPEIVKVKDNGNGEVDIFINEQLFTTYHYSEKVARPFLNPVIGPEGKNVLREPAPEGNPENLDHIHHRGIWVSHGDVNGTDNWSEEEGHGRTLHKKFLSLISGPVFGKIHSLNEWVDNKGKKILEEERIIIVYNMAEKSRIIDHVLIFRATEGEVVFKDTKESGLLSVRVNPSMEGRNTGLIVNSTGAKGGKECWGKRAFWCDYSGEIDGIKCGISIFDFPENLRYPTWWHVRDYGLMTANFFGLSDFYGNKKISGTYILPAYEEFKLYYRIYIHSGDVNEGNVKEMFLNFIYSPEIKMG